MDSWSPDVNLQQWSKLISSVVEATLNQNQSTLNQLLNQVTHEIPSQQEESLRGQIARNLLIQIARELEKSLQSPTHPTLAWFATYVGLGSSPPTAIQAVQMLLDQGFKPFEDFFVDRQGIHIYDFGTTEEKLNQMPARLSEFTQMTVTVNASEVNQAIQKFNLSESEARNLLVNLKILEQKMNVPVEELLSVLESNEELLQQTVYSDLAEFED